MVYIPRNADYVRQYATPEALLARGHACSGKRAGSSSEDGSDAKMGHADGDGSEDGFLSSSDDEEEQ
jgi:hypothetical protein